MKKPSLRKAAKLLLLASKKIKRIRLPRPKRKVPILEKPVIEKAIAHPLSVPKFEPVIKVEAAKIVESPEEIITKPTETPAVEKIEEALKEVAPPPEETKVEIIELPLEEEEETPVEPPTVFEELDLSLLEPEKRAEEESVKNLPPVMHKIPKELIEKIPTEWKPVELTKVDEKYPLIPPHAYAHIKWVPEKECLLYFVIEPPLTAEEKKKLEKIKNLLVDLLDVNLFEVKDIERARKFLLEKTEEIIADYGIKMTKEEHDKILYYVERDFLGLERIEPLMKDPNIEDISCIGVQLPIYVYHRKYGSVRTNVKFDTTEELNSFIIKLAQRCGGHISVANPLLDGALPDGSRVQATLSTGDIAIKGSTFTIRKFTKDPLTITDLMRYGTIPSLLAAFLWLAIEHRKSILVSGGTATGKTTFLNALALFIPPEAKIISIEDTPELRLPHENWVPKVARPGFGPPDITGRRMGEVSMFDLLKAALRERPDYIIVGEVRGREAYVLFQGMSTGHPGLATIHAEDMNALINRLITPPIALPPGLLQSLDLVVFMTHAKVKGMEVRRVREIVEIVDVDLKTGRPITNTLFRWNPGDDTFSFVSDRSYVLDRIIEQKGVSEESVWSELKRRKLVLDWLLKKNIRYYKDVGKIISLYYKDPETVLRRIEEDME